MKKSSTVMPNGAYNGLLLKILGIFALVLIILLIIYFATSRKKIEHFTENTLRCNGDNIDRAKQLIETCNDKHDYALYTNQENTLNEIKENVKEVRILASTLDGSPIDIENIPQNNYDSKFINDIKKYIDNQKSSVERCIKGKQYYNKCFEPMTKDEIILEIAKVKKDIDAYKEEIKSTIEQMKTYGYTDNGPLEFWKKLLSSEQERLALLESELKRLG